MFMGQWIIVCCLLLVLFVSGCVMEEFKEITETDVSPTTTPEEISSTTTKTTETRETTSTTEEVETTTSIDSSKRCRFLNFQIKSHLYRHEHLKMYFHNLGSEDIDAVDFYFYFTNKTSKESFTDQDIVYHSTKIYDFDIGPGLDNITVVDTECGKSYFVNV